MKKFESTELEQPLNANERFLYQAVVRLDALCHMMSSFLEVYAQQNGLATTENKVEEKVTHEEIKIEDEKPKTRKRRNTKK